MQNLNNVNNAQSASGDRIGNNNSTENLFDRLNQTESKGLAGKFSAILSDLKSQFGGNFGGKDKGDVHSFDKVMSDSRQQADIAHELKNKKLDEDEEKKKNHSRRSEANDRIRDINSEAASMQLQSAITAGNQIIDQNVEKDKQIVKDREELIERMRPSDILAAAMSGAQSGSSAAMSGSSSASMSGSSSASGKSGDISGAQAVRDLSGSASGAAASSAASGAASGPASGASSSGSAAFALNAAASGAALTEAAASGSSLTASNAAASAATAGNGQGQPGQPGTAPAGYGIEPDTAGSQAAAEMMRVEGVESDVEIESDLNNINRSNLASTNSTEVDPYIESSKQISGLNNKELRQNLDVLARESNVSKLSLQMTNPQTAAAARRDAEAIADMPKSQDRISSMTSSSQAQGNLLNSLNGSVQGAAQTISGSAVRAGAVASGRVTAVGTEELSSESLIKTAQAQKQSHGSESLGSRATLSQQGARAVTSRANDQAAANSLNTARSSLSNSAVQARQQTQAADEAASSALNTRNAAETAALKGAEPGNNAAAGRTGNAQEALMRLAQEQMSAGRNANAMAEANARNALLADDALRHTGSAELSSAIASLKQGARGVSGSSTNSTNYANSSLYASMFDSDNAVNSAENEMDMGFEHDDSASAFGSAMMTSQASENRNAPLPQTLTTFTPTGNENSDAEELHERVMEMASRNLKQLSVELSPNEMGRMKISISLSEDNEALSVSLAAANPATREMLEKALPKLREILANQNISTDAEVSDMDNEADSQPVLAADGREKQALSTITSASAAKRNNLSVAAPAMDNVSVDSLMASARSLTAQDREEISAVHGFGSGSEGPMDLDSASDTLAAFARRS